MRGEKGETAGGRMGEDARRRRVGRRHNGDAIGSRAVVVDRVARSYAREGVLVVVVVVVVVGGVVRVGGGGVGGGGGARGTTADRVEARAVHARGERADESARGDVLR